MIASVFSAPWFWWAVGIAIGLPVLLVILTEWQQSLRRRSSPLLRPVGVLRNFLVPLSALLLAMVGATQIPATATPVRIVGTLVAVVVLVLMLSGLKASLFQSASEGTWRGRIPSIFVDVVRFGLIAIGVALIFAYIWGANIGGLFTALGIGSIVIGLTLQNSVGQIISGLLMLFEQPFKIGETIETSIAKGRVVEVNWRAVHLKTGTGLQIIPNSVLAGQTFKNLSRPKDAKATRVTSVFAVEDHPDVVCAMLIRCASQLPECHPDLTPTAIPLGNMQYRTRIPLQATADDDAAEATFLRWIWYASRRQGLHLDEAEDGFSDPELVAEALRTRVAPILRLSADQQQAMAPHSTIECFAAGELIQATGVVPEAVSFILSGTVEVVAVTDDGSRAGVTTLEEGSYLGQSTLIRHPVTGSSFAVDEVTVIRVEREAIERVVQRSPVLMQEFGRAIDERRVAVLRAMSDSDTAITPASTPEG